VASSYTALRCRVVSGHAEATLLAVSYLTVSNSNLELFFCFQVDLLAEVPDRTGTIGYT